jgi:hypothetical protein
MNHDVDVLTMVRRANPLPDIERFDPDEVAAGVAAIEAAWQAKQRTPTARPLPAPSSHRPLRYAIAFVAAAVIALVLIGGPILLRDRQEAPVIQEPTTTMPTTVTTAPIVTTTVAATTTTVTTTTMPLVPMPGITFTRGSKAEIPEAMIETMIQGGPGLIAVGVSMACGTVDGEFGCTSDGGIWISADGGPWEATTDPTLLGGSAEWIYDVVAGPLGIVAVGEDEGEGEAAVWVSSDGIAWSRVARSDDLGRNSKMFSVAFGGPGVVAVGTTGGLYAGVWVSDDAATWTRVEDSDFAGDSEPAVMRFVEATPSGLLAAGNVGFAEGYDQAGTERLVLWVSPDGLEWERLPDDTLENLGVRDVDSIQGGDAEFLMIGPPIEEDGEGIWASPDGRTWNRIAVPYMGSPDEPGTVDHIGTQWDGSRWVSVGFEQSTGQVWASFELGVPWQPVGLLDTEAFSDGFGIGGLIVSETGFVIISTYESTYGGEEPARFNTWTGTWDD